MATMSTTLSPLRAVRPASAPAVAVAPSTFSREAAEQLALAELFPDLRAAADAALEDLFPALRLRRARPAV